VIQLGVVSIVLSPLFICFDENANSNRGWMGSFPFVHGFCVGLGFDLNCFRGGMDGNWRWSCAIKVLTQHDDYGSNSFMEVRGKDDLVVEEIYMMSSPEIGGVVLLVVKL